MEPAEWRLWRWAAVRRCSEGRGKTMEMPRPQPQPNLNALLLVSHSRLCEKRLDLIDGLETLE